MVSYFLANNVSLPQAMISGFVFFLIILMVWSLIWKGMALWRAARRGEKVWFIVFLLVNTVGILEILYLYVFGREDKLNKTTTPDYSKIQK